TIGAFYPGAFAFGRSDEVVCTNCVINQFGDSTYHTAGGVLEKGPGDNGVNNSYSMNDGVIIIPNGSSINAAADNGSGKVRLTVQSTAGLISGNYYLVDRVVGTTEANGVWQITVVDGTHLDIPPAYKKAYKSGGRISAENQPGAAPQRWAVPGTNLFWADQNRQAILGFRIVDVTQDATNTYIQTNLKGGFPAVSPYNGKLFIRVHPAPKFTCASCTGSVEALILSQASGGTPLYSYYKRTFDGSVTNWPWWPIWG